jgi:hypothetical protein
MKQRARTRLAPKQNRNRRLTKSKPGESDGNISSFSIAPYLLIVFTLTGATIGVMHGWQLLQNSGRLWVKEIQIEGMQRVNEQELEAYLGIELGDGILSVDLDSTAVGLCRHPWVKEAKVRRQLPHTVVAEIIEHKPSLLVALNEMYVANHEGNLFKNVDPEDKITLPVLTGLTRGVAESESNLMISVVRDAISFSEAYTQSSWNSQLGRIEEIAWDRELGWSLVFSLKGGPTVLHLGAEPMMRLEAAVRGLNTAIRAGHSPVEIWAGSALRRRRVQIRLNDYFHPSRENTLIAKAGD